MNNNMTKTRYIQINKAFKTFVKDKANHPTKDETYGTKIEGNVKFEHFILLAMLRGTDPRKTTHDDQSENYLDQLSFIKRSASQIKEGRTPYGFEQLNKPFGLTESEFVEIVEQSEELQLKAS